MIQVLMVDDHKVFRDAMAFRLREDPEIQVVGEAGSAQEAYPLADSLSPDLVLLDISLPGGSGITAARELLRRDRKRRVMFLTQHADTDTIAQALSTGAKGYALKEQPFEEVRQAMLLVARGEQVLPPGASREEVEERMAHQGNGQGNGASGSPLSSLTSREKEIFDLLAHGLTNGAIAGRLRISVNTVETHRAHILKKLGVHSLSDIVRVAARHGLLHHA